MHDCLCMNTSQEKTLFPQTKILLSHTQLNCMIFKLYEITHQKMILKKGSSTGS